MSLARQSWWFQLLPLWIREYRSEDLRFDVVAGITVGILLIPQSMAYALVAGVPPVYGLYASTLPAIMYSLFGTCRQLSVGPAAMVSLLTASGMSMIAVPESEEYIALVVLLTLMVGLIQFSLGVARLGFLINFLSHPVMLGFTQAAVWIIGLGQIKYFFGIQLDKNQFLHEILTGLIRHITGFQWIAFVTGCTALAILIYMRKKYPRFPAALIVVTAGILVTWGFRLDLHGLSIVGDIMRGFPDPVMPHLDMIHILPLLSTAFAIALVSFMESTAVSRTMQGHHKTYTVVPNKELMALGLANMTSSVLRAMPVTGGLSRSMVNDHAGARSGLASIISAVLIILTLLWLTGLFYYLPTVILAAIILVAAVRFIRLQEIKNLWEVDRKDFYMMAATFLATLFLGISIGIGLGVFLSLSWIIFEASYPHHAELGRVPGTNTFRNVRRFAHLDIMPGVLIFRFDAPLFFVNANRFHEVLVDYLRQRPDAIHSIVVNMESINTMDSSAARMLSELLQEMKERNIRFLLAEVKGPVRDSLYKAGIMRALGEEHIFVNIDDALQHIQGVRGSHIPQIAVQTNIPRD